MAERFGRPPGEASTPAAAAAAARSEPEATEELSAPAPIPVRGPGTERIDSQVQKAHEQLLSLKRQQEQIERQKRELEELSRRQEDLERGRSELIEKLTRALVVVERQSTEAAKRVEQLHATSESFTAHLQTLEAINPKSWASSDLQRELNRALGMVDHARSDYNQQKSRFASEAAEGAAGEAGAGGEGYNEMFGDPSDHNFLYWMKAGLAFTLPLLVLGLIALGVIMWRLFAGPL